MSVDALSFVRTFVANFLLWLLLAWALFLLWATRGNRRVRRWWAALLLAIWLLASRPVAEALAFPLERQYRPPGLASLRAQGVRQVVVLMGGSYPLRGETLSSAFSRSSLRRFLGGLEICEQLGPGCRMVVSGSAGPQRSGWADALTMQRLARTLAPTLHVLAEAVSQRTADHPAQIRSMVGDDPFILVTSAVHMPRAMRSFRRASLHPVAYPVDYLAVGHYSWDDWLPWLENLEKVQDALWEYLGLAFYVARGW